MRWEDEPYVRLYKRETPEWAVLSWEARALFHEMLKKTDLAGILIVGKSGLRGLAGLVRMPVNVVDRALHGEEGLLADGCVVEIDGGYLMPNYVEAQQARQSDRARKQEQRNRDRAAKLATSRAVTPRPPASEVSREQEETGQSVTNRDDESQNVTDRHGESHDVTRGHSEQSKAKQSAADVSEQAPPPPERPDDQPGGGALRDVLVRELSKSELTRFLSVDDRALGMLEVDFAARGLPIGTIPDAVAWAASRLAVESADIGGGVPLNRKTTLEKIISGFAGEGTKRRRQKNPPAHEAQQPSPSVDMPPPPAAAVANALDRSWLVGKAGAQ